MLTPFVCLGRHIYVCMHACMHACMHGWMDGWMDGFVYICSNTACAHIVLSCKCLHNLRYVSFCPCVCRNTCTRKERGIEEERKSERERER